MGTDHRLLLHFVEAVWGLERPNLVVSITGGATDSLENSDELQNVLLDLMSFARNTSAWLTTGGTHGGIMKLIGVCIFWVVFLIMKQSSVSWTGQARYRFGAKIPLLAIVPFGFVSGNEDLETKEGFANHGYLTSDPVVYDPKKRPLRMDNPKAFAGTLDPNHSHFILVSLHLYIQQMYRLSVAAMNWESRFFTASRSLTNLYVHYRWTTAASILEQSTPSVPGNAELLHLPRAYNFLLSAWFQGQRIGRTKGLKSAKARREVFWLCVLYCLCWMHVLDVGCIFWMLTCFGVRLMAVACWMFVVCHIMCMFFLSPRRQLRGRCYQWRPISSVLAPGGGGGEAGRAAGMLGGREGAY